MIIKTFNSEETKVAAGIRDSLRAAGHNVYLAPEGVEVIYLTIVVNEYTGFGEIVIYLETMEDELLDTVCKFEDCDSAYQYARELAVVCGLDPEEAVTRDVFDGIAVS